MSQRYVMHIKNTDINETRRIVKEMRKVAKKYGVRLYARGRCVKRREVLTSVGRTYNSWVANHNDFYLNHPAADKCHTFAIYRTLSTSHSEDVMSQIYWDFLNVISNHELVIIRSGAKLKV